MQINAQKLLKQGFTIDVELDPTSGEVENIHFSPTTPMDYDKMRKVFEPFAEMFRLDPAGREDVLTAAHTALMMGALRRSME